MMALFKWGAVGLILLSISAAELLGGSGQAIWSIGYWLAVMGALWSASVGYRFNRRKVAIEEVSGRGVAASQVRRRLNAVGLISLSAGMSVAYWGVAVRFIIHGTLWQALPFYATGFCLMALWWPREFRPPTDKSTTDVRPS